MHRAIRAAAVGIVAAVLAFGCTNPDDGVVEPIDAPVADEDSGDNVEVEPEPDAAEDTDPEPESAVDPTPEIDISVIPDEITVEYVDAVLVELERLFADAVRSVVESEEMTLLASDSLSSAFGGTELDAVFADLLVVAEDPSIANSPDDIVPNTLSTVEVLDVAAECLWVETVADMSGVFSAAPEPRLTFVLLRTQERDLVVELNPTPWVYRAIRVDAEAELRAESPCV